MILIATQLMPRGSLRTVLRDPEARQELRWHRRGRGIALDLAEALDYMHTQLRMLHSDLKARGAGWVLPGIWNGDKWAARGVAVLGMGRQLGRWIS